MRPFYRTDRVLDYRCYWTNLGLKKHLKILTSTSSLLQTNRHNKRPFDLDVMTSTS